MYQMWILIILITKPTGTAVTSVPNFSTEQACLKAANKIAKENDTQIGPTMVHYSCVKSFE